MNPVTLEAERLPENAGNAVEGPIQPTSPLTYLPHGLCQFDASERLVIANPPFQKMYGLPDELVQCGVRCDQLLSGLPDPQARSLLAEVIHARKGFEAGARQWTNADGRIIAVSCQAIPGGGCVTLHEDVTRVHLEQSKLSRLAFDDALTGLLNRSAFRERFSQSLESLDGNRELALMCIDLDFFKPVNDTLGHPIGDRLLQMVAKRLTQLIRAEDVVARLGGDEFAVLQVGSLQPAGSRTLAKRIVKRLSEPYIIDEQVVHVGASIGVAIAPFDGSSVEELMKNADLALYRAKEDGRGVLRYFEPEMDARMQARRALEVELRQALSNREFEMHYQPILDIESQRIVCFEALVRWNHPQLGRVPPDRFIPLAEETGLILPLGEWVLQQACRDARDWDGDIRVAVNLSPVQLRDLTMIQSVQRALQDSGLPARRLELEITESSLIANTELTIGLLHQLRELGLRIAMDDYGTGYSSISYLRRFPFDKIKIDRSFISGNDRGPASESLVRMIASLGSCLGAHTTAEGVETSEELNSAREAGCTEIQGYLLSKPMRASEIAEFLQNRHHPRASAGAE